MPHISLISSAICRSANCRNVLVLLLSLLLLSACSFSLAADVTPPPGSNVQVSQPTQAPLTGPLYPLVPPNPANGAAIYADKCAPCHGLTGQGDGPQASQLPNPAAPIGSPEFARQSTPAGWFAMVTQGNLEKFMPPFNSLSAGERWDVIAYVYTLSSSEETFALGEELYQANCASCHGDLGQGDGTEAASLSTPATDFTDQERMYTRSAAQLFEAISAGSGADMPAFGDTLGENERWALATYLRSLTFSTRAETAGMQQTPVAPGTPEAQTTEPVAVVTPQAGVGTVTGRLVNTSGSGVPAELEITLHGFDEMKETYTVNATAKADGSFTFEEVEMPLGRAFIASVEYSGAVYGSDIAVVKDGTTLLDLSIPISETTTDVSLLSVDRLHIFFDYIDPGKLRVVELFIVSNLSDRTVVAAGDGSAVISFDLPEGATNLQFEDGVLGGRYIQTPAGFADTASVRPGSGEHQVVFTFELPYERKLEIAQPLNLPVNAVVILVPEDGIKIKSDLLQDSGSQDFQGVAYRMYKSDRLEAGTELAMTLSGKPGGSGASLVAGSNTSLVIGFGAFGLALIAVGAWLYSRNRAASHYLQSGEEFDTDLSDRSSSDDPETLMDAILNLDEEYQAGDLPEEAYLQRRLELKTRLKELVKNQGAEELGP
ncbi:MAG TPA: c-type cytochrome [Anaerolineales bacterium]|nr:c-type cytochrome [Anaerolineales bacterium]